MCVGVLLVFFSEHEAGIQPELMSVHSQETAGVIPLHFIVFPNEVAPAASFSKRFTRSTDTTGGAHASGSCIYSLQNSHTFTPSNQTSLEALPKPSSSYPHAQPASSLHTLDKTHPSHLPQTHQPITPVRSSSLQLRALQSDRTPVGILLRFPRPSGPSDPWRDNPVQSSLRC